MRWHFLILLLFLPLGCAMEEAPESTAPSKTVSRAEEPAPKTVALAEEAQPTTARTTFDEDQAELARVMIEIQQSKVPWAEKLRQLNSLLKVFEDFFQDLEPELEPQDPVDPEDR